MKKRTWKTCRRGLAAMLGLMLSIQTPFGSLVPLRQSYAYTERSAKVNASTLNVRSGPGTANSLVTKLAKGTAVTVINEKTGTDGKLWYQIRFSSGQGTSTGYVLGSYIRFPVTYTPNADFEQEMNAQGFPESYKTELRQLHAQYPNWVFEAQHTGLDWNTVIQNEGVLGRNLVGTESISSYKSLVDGAYNWDNGTWTGFDGSAWVAASEEILKYYMDPRNFLDDVFIFQFMSQEYDPNLQTKAGLENMIKGTFLEGAVKTGNISGSSGSTSSGGGSSAGPGGSGSSSGQSSGVIVSPSGGRGQSSTGSGPSGGSSAGSSSSGSSSSGGSPSGSSQPQVELRGPQASISTHKTERVASSADSVVVGVMPGSGSSGGQGSQGAPVTSAVPGTSTQPGTGTAPAASPAPGTSSGTITAGTSAGPGTSAAPGGAQAPGQTGASASGSASYADIIMKAAEQTGVNPYVLAAMILQEQGKDGRGRSITGTNSSYPGYYNYFNVGAYASGNMGAIERGLWYASQNDIYGRPWNTPEKSILGGAEFYAANYVKAGQNTLYLKKYNVQGSNIYKHQYMTNVDGAASEASYFAEGYAQSLKSTKLHFKIPVYTNMPDTPCARPTIDGSPNNKLSGLGVEGFVLTPTFHRDTVSYDLIVDPSVSNVSVYANTIDSKASVSGSGNIQLQNGNNDIRIKVTAQNGSEREYVIHVVRQSNGPTYNAGLGGNSSGGGTVTPGTAGNGSYGPGVTGPGAGSSGPGGSSQSGISAGNGIGQGATPGGSNVIVIGQ